MTTVNDRMPFFSKAVEIVMEDALKEGARDLLIKSRNYAPFDKGQLRADSETTRQGKLHHRVSYFKEYALPQEKGSAGNKTFRNYTTPGTGKKYLQRAGDEVAQQIAYTFKKHGGRI